MVTSSAVVGSSAIPGLCDQRAPAQLEVLAGHSVSCHLYDPGDAIPRSAPVVNP